MKSKSKSLLSAFVACGMVFAHFPFNVFAVSENQKEDCLKTKSGSDLKSGFTAGSENVSVSASAIKDDKLQETLSDAHERSSEAQYISNSQESFDAYFFWMTSGGQLCYHKFTGLQGIGQKKSFPVNYINATDITDESGHGADYEFGQGGSVGWALSDDVEENGAIKSSLSASDVFGGGEGKGVVLDLYEIKNGKSTISTNAGGNFRTTIYDDKHYEGVNFGESEADYKYFPDFLDTKFFDATVDVSGTTKENPAVYKTFLLEPLVKFKACENSKSQFKSVKALDVDDMAVKINHNQQDNSFSVEFSSNFYDKVVFEIEDEAGEKYYVKLCRLVMDVKDNFDADNKDASLTAFLYLPNEKNYDEYQILASVLKKDGKKAKPLILNPAKIGDIVDEEAVLNDNGYSKEAGRGLKSVAYTVDLSQYGGAVEQIMSEVSGVYFTVIKKGALDSENYGGTFSGSGQGTFYDISQKEIVFN